MSVFGNYARYYDLLYRDKDYADEAKFVHDLMWQHCPKVDSILELGCGTGAHALELAKLGNTVQGVDLSIEMLTCAQDRLKTMTPEVAERLTFGPGDIRSVRMERRFSAVISLFHVISYQVNNRDLDAAFATVEQHLKEGGVFIFDCWYGPAVLTQKPEVRVKRLADNDVAVTRIAEPTMEPNANIVNVNYTIFIQDKFNGTVGELRETHRMRYLFMPELEIMLAKHSLQITLAQEWMTRERLSCATWGACIVARKMPVVEQ